MRKANIHKNHNSTISLNFYTSLDSRPPDPTAGKIDYGTAVGVTYKF